MCKSFKLMKYLIFIIFILIALTEVLMFKFIINENNKINERMEKLEIQSKLYYEDILQLLEN